MTTEDIEKDFKKLANPAQAVVMERFFKTGPGQYGEGDIFLGIKVPVLRRLSRKYYYLSLSDISELLCSSIHEYRFLALVLLVTRFQRSGKSDKEKIFNFYLQNKNYVNSWDLVDMSAPNIPGQWLMMRDKAILYSLASSQVLWDRRISIISTFYFIKNHYYDDTLKIAENLLNDQEDLIHKAVGWMLREVGKRDMETEEAFLKKNCASMPRTMLRYAIEKFPEDLRKSYLQIPRTI